MKESWIKKLIELLNEYEAEKEKSERADVDIYVEFEWGYTDYNWLTRWDKTDQWEWDNLYWDTAVAYLISKSFWMIKWLVENDKIDKKKINKLIKWQEVWYGYEVQEEEYYSIYESLLMLLSISDTPIDDLILYLK